MKVQTPEAGGVAESLAGHDRGRLYLIVGTEGGRVLLADGAAHPAQQPKKKNVRHLRLLPLFHPEIALRIGQGKDENSNIRAALKQAAEEKQRRENSCPKTM